MATSLEKPYDSEEDTKELVMAQDAWVSIKDAVDTIVTKLESDPELMKENDRRKRLLQFKTDSIGQFSHYS